MGRESLGKVKCFANDVSTLGCDISFGEIESVESFVIIAVFRLREMLRLIHN